jgi:hypothetical protein
MYEIGQKVVVISDNAIAFDATIFARAKGDNGLAAYKVGAPAQPGESHKACDVFIPEQTAQEERDSWNHFLKS